MGADLFAHALELDIPAIQGNVQSLAAAIKQADREQAGFFTQLLWPLFRSGRFANLALAMETMSTSLKAINVQLPAPPMGDSEVQGVGASLATATKNLEALKKAISYRTALKELQKSRPLEEIAREESGVLERIARDSEMLWKLWLRLQPSMLSAAERKQLGRYCQVKQNPLVLRKGGAESETWNQ